MKLTNFLYALIVFFIIACSHKQNEVYNYKSDFRNLINKSKAKSFDYQYDGLSPQKSYFIECKLKFLELESHGELTDNKKQIIFENDSISKIYELKEMYDENNNQGGRSWNQKNDSLFISDFKKGNIKAYLNGEFIYDKEINKRLKNEYIYKIKTSTENEYNCGKSK